MNLLLDNNVLIAAYPETGSEDEAKSKSARLLINLANQHGHTTYIHAKAINRDSLNSPNKDWWNRITSAHPSLPDAPEVQDEITEAFGNPDPSTNDWSDHLLLAAVYAHAVNKLVTEDKGIHSKAQRLGLGEQVGYIDDAIADILARAPQKSDAALLPYETKAHTLDPSDPIFNTLRQDYHDFDSWLRKCQEEQRVCWVIKANGNLGGLAIVKDEPTGEHGIIGKTLKICTFKVSEDCSGMRYGELLLKSILDYAYANHFEFSYVTVLPKYGHVVAFAEKFGFEDSGHRTESEEIVLVKAIVPPSEFSSSSPDTLEYHRLYGPKYYQLDAPRFVIPITPKWRKELFPEASEQFQFQMMGIMTPAGNSIQKAYLSGSRIKGIRPGSILYFYESHERRRIVAIGIAEEAKAFKDAVRVADFVGKRTVYSLEQIDRMTNGRKSCSSDTLQTIRYAQMWVNASRATGGRRMESGSSVDHVPSRIGGRVDANTRGQSKTPAVVLLPIHPEYVDRIRDGSKQVEFRRTNFRRTFKYAIIYATSPEKRIAGYCEVSEVARKSPEDLWSEHGQYAGIARDRLLGYLNGLPLATAIVIREFHHIGGKVALSTIGVSRAPQGFRYLKESVIDNLKLHSTCST